MCEGGFTCCEPVFFKTVLSRGPYCRAPYPIEWCGTMLSLASSGESLRGGWFSQPSRGANSIFSRRAALVAHARTSGSRDLSSASSIQLFISYHPHLDCDSRSLPSSLTWFVHSILHFLPPPSLLLIAFGPQSTISQSIAAPTL
jgi:hypothetical protein